jgi:FkbM family methyltransferase
MSYTLCLNMIVKDEAHIIENTFAKLLDKVKIDYWVISDTGSTDNTKEIIIDFFKQRGIPGELYDDAWENFGHNRTTALRHAYNKSDYLLIFDADDEICGDFQLPNFDLMNKNNNNKDAYSFRFGDSNGIQYIRTQLINNRKKWKYVGVLHEYITCCEHASEPTIIQGNYYTISGRTSQRNKDTNKYLKDAYILEKAYEEAFQNKDEIYNRYGFYCANSYYDAQQYDEALKWYKITLENKNWAQEKYVSCQRIYNIYTIRREIETGFFYLVKAFSYDTQRVECLYELVVYYCKHGMNDIAYNYYKMVKPFYDNVYLTTRGEHEMRSKLFLDVSRANFFLPYYMIIIAYYANDVETGIQMYRILFTKKYKEFNTYYIGNLLSNIQFYIDKVKDDTDFLKLFQEYVDFLLAHNYPIETHHVVMDKYEKYGITFPIKQTDKNKFTPDECRESKKILLYTGYLKEKWNYTYSLANPVGGSETAAISLARSLPPKYEIYIGGDVIEEKIDNITFVNSCNLDTLLRNTAFHTIIVSRYINFFEHYRYMYTHQTYIWAHDIHLITYGTYSNVNDILINHSDKIKGCICQTEWHKNLYTESYKALSGKIHVINNGIDTSMFEAADMTTTITTPTSTPTPTPKPKVKNRFIYSSCPERGLERLLELWPRICEKLENAELYICTYNNFPRTDSYNYEKDMKIQKMMEKHDNVKYMGKLIKPDLYLLMSTCEYWFYPTNFNETSCITAMEMLMSEVVCIYYPMGGLVNTMSEYGIQVQVKEGEEGEEIQTIVELSESTPFAETRKKELRERGKEYAMSCDWKNRSKMWEDILFNSVEALAPQELSYVEKQMFALHERDIVPSAHKRVLNDIKKHFTPRVIYDIGACVLHWTREAMKIWPEPECITIAFDAINEVEALYKSKGILYHIGVLSDEDNKLVKFYENKEMPGGNSYYKEIGHAHADAVFPENSYTEKHAMTLESVVQQKNFQMPDLVKIDVQGCELDILKGGINIINHARYLIIELQHVQYNRGAPLEYVTIKYLNDNGWEIVEAKFVDNGPDADYLFINTRWVESQNM